MTRQLVNIALLFIFVLACKSPTKLIEQGNYDKAIEKSIKKMLKGNADTDDKLMLDKAYRLANQQDEERIKFLKSEGKPENWEQIYFTYSRLDRRQNQVRKVLPFQIKGKTFNYNQKDYASLLAESKTKAAEYHYAFGKRLMEDQLKESYRSAYQSFLKAKKYRESAFPDINNLIDEAKLLGTTYVLIEVSNATNARFPADFYDKLLAINTSGLESNWVNYIVGRNSRSDRYDYLITLEIQNIIVSPEEYSSKETQRKKRVEDGFEYVLDSRGNVMKDSLGNDIKIPKYKQLTCVLIEREQHKEATIEAQVVFLQTTPRQIKKREALSGTSVFNHVSARAIGDYEALLPENKVKLKAEPLPFPDDLSMLMDCTEPLKNAFEDIVRSNKNLIY